MVNPESASTNQNSSAAHERNESNTHGDNLSGAKTYNRSSFTRTASDTQKSRKPPTRKYLLMCKPLAPLSVRSAGVSSRTRRRKPGPTTSMPTAHIAGINSHTQQPKKRVRRRLSGHSYSSAAIIHSRASLLLSQARQSIKLEAAWSGKKRCIMDAILDSKPPIWEHNDGSLAHAIRRSQQSCSSRREYDFTDEQSLDTYWADQAAIWTDTRTIVGTTTRFPDSGERSTASWTAALNGRSKY